MGCSSCQHLLILHVPDIDIVPSSDIRYQLSESPVGIAVTEFGDRLKECNLLRSSHGRTSTDFSKSSTSFIALSTSSSTFGFVRCNHSSYALTPASCPGIT